MHGPPSIWVRLPRGAYVRGLREGQAGLTGSQAEAGPDPGMPRSQCVRAMAELEHNCLKTAEAIRLTASRYLSLPAYYGLRIIGR